MSDHIIPCDRCGGTGELRLQWWVVEVYQDGRDEWGPFGSRPEAVRTCEERNRAGRGSLAFVEERVIR